jgi:hypothetical protein
LKILVVDRPFPTNEAQWKIEEVKSFILHKDVDVMSLMSKEENYKEMKEYYGLNDYNVLIFNPRFNYLNKHNRKFDGTIFNNKYPGDYVVTKNKDFNIKSYDIIYHIFYSRWRQFNSLYKLPQNKQVIHLYPGGGFNLESINSIPKDVHIITTQKYYTNLFLERGYINIKEVLGAFFVQKDNKFEMRNLNNNKIIVCMTSVHDKKVKGHDVYESVVSKYKSLYKKDNIDFIFIGKQSFKCNDIKTYPIMPMSKLKKIFETVDIYINPEQGSFSNGWPLGVESMLKGSVLITTDPFNSSIYYKQYSDDVIIVKNDNDIIMNIKKLYDDRNLLLNISNRLQKNVNEFYSFDNQQQKIFDYIDEIGERNGTKR